MKFDFLGEKEEITSISSKNNKYKFELIAALFLYLSLELIFRFTSWDVEWLPGKVSLLLAPFILLVIFRRPLESIGLKTDNILKNAKQGLLLGSALAIGLAVPLRIWTPSAVIIDPGSNIQIIYIIFMLFVYVTSAEIFYRGYLQPRLELLGGSLLGLVTTSIISGIDFWESSTVSTPIAILVAFSFGWLYIKNRSIIGPIIGRLLFMSLIIFFASV